MQFTETSFYHIYNRGNDKRTLFFENRNYDFFLQNTKFKCVDSYLSTAFHYIHQNSFRANLVDHIEDWKWSSLQEYLGLTSEEICKKEIAYSYLDIKKDRLLEDSYLVIPDEFISELQAP